MPIQKSSEKPSEKYNRIVIVGNGFDRALDLDTGYPSFLLYYLKKTAEKLLFRGPDGNELFTFHKSIMERRAQYTQFPDYINGMDTIEEALTPLKEKLNYKPNSFLLKMINFYKKKRWVDIEQLYYEELQSCIAPNGVADVKRISNLNKSMDELSKELNEYINDQQKTIDSELFDKFQGLAALLVTSIYPTKRANIKKHGGIQNPDKVMFLNFNYTKTISHLIRSPYASGKAREVFEVKIHGSVNDEENPIIFGYGDDTGDEYKMLENINDREAFRMIKSFKYPQTNNYHKILGFIEDLDFEIFILGHSCGLSDRTLLKTLFEHPKCRAIQVLHYNGKGEFFDKNIEISRHFEDKVLMRERLLPFDPTAKIPQNKL